MVERADAIVGCLLGTPYLPIALREENVLKELPFGFPGRVFGSPMPFGDFDRDDALDRFVQIGVSVVVVLAEERECFRRSGRDLIRLYREGGFEVIHVPTEDFGTPQPDALREAVDVALEHARAGRHVVVHCWAGIGRTGMFLAGMACRGLGMGADEAIEWVRGTIDGAVQTAEQEEMVRQVSPAADEGCRRSGSARPPGSSGAPRARR